VKKFLQYTSNRFGYSGWALKIKDAPKPMGWSTCTTREEARELKREWEGGSDLFRRIEVVKVKISVGVVE